MPEHPMGHTVVGLASTPLTISLPFGHMLSTADQPNPNCGMLLDCLFCWLQHKKHSGDVDDEKLAAAKAFLEQHLKQTAGGAGGTTAATLAAAAAAGGGGSSKPSSSKSREKPAGELPADVDPITMDDYFERSSEFTAWLQETRHQYFNGMTLTWGQHSTPYTAGLGCQQQTQPIQWQGLVL